MSSGYYHFDLGLRTEVQRKLNKLMEPAPVKNVKPLPKPDDLPKKRRAGKRYKQTTVNNRLLMYSYYYIV